MSRFTVPRDIYYGKNSIEELRQLTDHKRAFVVTGDAAMQELGFWKCVVDNLEKAKMEVMLFEGVEPDPSVETVMRGAKEMQAFEPDVIVAIGGGSTIDAAKAMWVFYEHPDKTFEDIKEPYSIPKMRRKAIFVAIPSTSGTASEVTAFSVITDYEKKVKYPLADFEITPDIAILDTGIAKTMPKHLVAHTGMDALTHAIEAYVATANSLFTDPLALEAISLIDSYLVDSYNGNQEAKEQMHIAQCLAGMAFSNALLGITHSLSHKVGAQFNLPHGLCNAVLLPYVIQFNSKTAMSKYAQIARTLGLSGNTDKQLLNSLICEIKWLNQKVDIENCFKACNVPKKVMEDNMDFIAREAVSDPCTASNPRPATQQDIQVILEAAYYGTPLILQ